MEVIKGNPNPKLIKVKELKPGDLFEYDNDLYIKSDKDFNIGISRTACIKLSTGRYVEMDQDIKVTLARLFGKALVYTLDN